MMASTSTQRPVLSIHTARTDRSNSSPTKSPLPLYQLPLETAKINRPRARPGGLAGQQLFVHDSSADRTRRRSNEHSLTRGSSTDQAPDQELLSLFAQHCRAFYIGGSPESGDYISHTLSTAPHSHRKAYSRLQTRLRALSHLHHLRVRMSSFHALISSTYASGSLSPASRSLLNGKGAQRERREKFWQFLATWDGVGMQPFLKGLSAVFDLTPKARSRRVVWEIDDAVFLESGGMEFMQSAVILLKGVLGFEDTPITLPPQPRTRTLPRASASRIKPSTSPRPRQSSRPPAPPLPEAALHQENAEHVDEDDVVAEEADLNRARFRLWTFPPHISDEEADSLRRLLPRSVRRAARFPFVPPGHGAECAIDSEDWEEPILGVRVPRPSTEALEGVVRLGTGRAWAGLTDRDRGFEGSRWFRFKQWWRRLFGMA